MNEQYRHSITLGKVPLFTGSYPKEFIKFVELPSKEKFFNVLAAYGSRNPKYFEMYWVAILSRYEGKTLQETGNLIGRSKERVRKIQEMFLRALAKYEQQTISG